MFIILISAGACQPPIHKVDDDDIFDTYYKFDTCVTPLSTGILKKYALIQYYSPEILNVYLDSIIFYEQNCPCYRNSASGFSVEFYHQDEEKQIIIRPLRKIFIGDYSKYNGFFVFKEHYFFCYGSIKQFKLKEIGNTVFYAYKPVEMLELMYFDYSMWEFDCSTDFKLIKKKLCN